MLKSRVGIILRSFLPYKHKLSVLTGRSGKISLIITHGQKRRIFSSGTIIRFSVKTLPQFPVVNKFEVVSVPMPHMNEHIYWLHHMFEIVYYFSPLESPCADLFQLVYWSLELAKCSHVFGSHFVVVKKICLVKLLIILGFYSEQELVNFGNLFDRIVFVFLDSSNGEKVRSLHALLHGVCQSRLQQADKWLWLCLQEHPHIARFKTISFLNKL